MKQLKTLLFGLLLPGVLVLCCSSQAKADGVVFHRQTVKVTANNVNDARIILNGNATAGALTTKGNPPVKTAGAVQGVTLIFAQDSFGTLNTGDKANIDFGGTGANRPTQLLSGSWTTDSIIVGVVDKIGIPMQLAVNTETNEAFATFFNPESFSITYSDIALFANNDLANLNIDEFFIPTGTLVSGPSTLTLAPGQSVTLSFGIVDPTLYQLALAQVFATSSPNDVFDVATAAAVPEPATLLLLGAGLAGIAAKLRRR